MDKFKITYAMHMSGEVIEETFTDAYPFSERLEEILNGHSAFINDDREISKYTKDAPCIYYLAVEGNNG